MKSPSLLFNAVPLLCISMLASCAEAAEPAAPPVQDNQRLNLSEVPTKPRFKVTNRVWPTKAGEASICLWNDDKLAAFSITIDDNTAPDVDWWLGKSKELNLPLTWFLISGRAGEGGYWGTWDLWKKVRDAGQAIESHTITHLHIDEPGWKSIEWEYADSIKQIEAGVPNHRVGFLAYPGGKNSKVNDRNVAAKYFMAARGTRGALNSVNQIDYLNVNATSSATLDNPKAPFADLRNLLNPEHRGYRGWGVLLYHLVKEKETQQRFFDFYKTNEKELWGATFGDVAMYGQQRDSASLTVEDNTAGRITFTLKDLMDDSRFTFPLTVKVRLPEVWKSANANQGNKSIEAKIIEHEGAKYALVKAVPDQGRVVLTP